MTTRWKKAFASAAVVAALATGTFLTWQAPAFSGGETRTISIYHVHTKESLTVTYMKGGKYIPSAMKKINRILRDWRRNEVIAISPRTIDLMWELHADLGSKQPVHIVSGYRSPKTNAFLKKIGRNVARKSQHMVGKAIDIYFPDVPTKKMRNSAIVRQVGGVGYYSGGGGPTGFLHIDSGRVRHWGPAISQREMASIMRDYRRTVGARLNRKGMKAVPAVEIAEADATAAGLPSQQEVRDEANKVKGKKKIPLETAYTEDDEELAGMSEDAAAPTAKPRARPELAKKPDAKDEPQQSPAETPQVADATEAEPSIAVPQTEAKASIAQAEAEPSIAVPQTEAEASVAVPQTEADAGIAVAQTEADASIAVPRPRPKPIEVLMMAAVNMKIEPASAPPPNQMARQNPSPLQANAIGVVPAPETLLEPETDESGKTSLTEELRQGEPEDVPVIRAMTTASAGGDVFWWPQRLIFDTKKAVRRDGEPQQFSESPLSDLLPGVNSAQAEPVGQQPARLTLNTMDQAPEADGKGDMLVVNREGKGSLLNPLTLRKTVQVQN